MGETHRAPNQVAFSEDAERAVLSAVLLDKADALADEVRSQLPDPHAFYDVVHRHVYASICDLREREQPADLVTVATDLEAKGLWTMVGMERLEEIVYATPSDAHLDEHVRIVRDNYRMRLARDVALKVASDSRVVPVSDPTAVQQLLSDAETAFVELSESTRAARLRPVAEWLPVMLSRLGAVCSSKRVVTGMTTGLGRLDQLTTGLQGGDLNIIAGRTGQGKTSLLNHISLAVAADGYGVAEFSLEMPAEQLVRRWVATIARVDLQLMNSGQLGSAEWTKITDAVNHLSKLPLYIDDTPSPTLADMRAAVGKLSKQLTTSSVEACKHQRLGLVAVDYLQLINNRMVGRSREQEVTETSKGLKAQARRFDVPYAVVSPLNRSVDQRADRRPQLSDLRESGAIEYDADLVLLLHRPETYKPDDDEVKGLAEIIVAKQRNGPAPATVKAKYVKSYTRFDNIEYRDEYDDFPENDWQDYGETRFP